MAVLMEWSKSTKVSACHSRWRSSSRVIHSPGWSTRIVRDGYVLNSGNPYGLWFGRPWVDDPVISDRIDGHSLLRKTKEQLTSTLGSSSVEAERELVQIVVKVLMTDRSLMGSDQPSFEERDDLVHSRHQLRWSLLLASEKRDLVFIALPFQGKVAQPAIGVNDASGYDRILHERNQAFGRSV